MSTPTTATPRQRQLLVALVLLLAVMIVVGIVTSHRKSTAAAAAAAASTAAAQQPAPQPPVQAAPPAPPADDDDPTEEPTRPAQASDAASAKEALASTVAAWGQVDITKAGLPGSWLSTLQATGSVTPNFVTQSNRDFYTLWGGAIQMDVNVTGSKISNQAMLWNTGSTSLWRVTIQRSLIHNTDPTAPRTTDKVTWDLLVEQPTSGPFSVDNFSAPSKRNTSPETYIPGE